MTPAAAPSAGIEEHLIQSYLAPLAAGYPGAFGLRDDCAVLAPPAGHDLVLKTDAIAEGVHFLPDDPPETIGWKALAVNVSDLAGKGARPLVYLMSLAFPAAPEPEWMAGFAAGLGEAQSTFGCHLAGGDTDRRPGPASIAITVIGAVPHGRMVRRGAARPGDRLYVSGTLGDAALGLILRTDAVRAAAWGVDADQSAHLIGRYRRPEPRLALDAALRTHASAAMDLSDGLLLDTERMMAASGAGASLQAGQVPLSEAARHILARDPAAIERILSGGDDYEILAAVPPGDAAAFERAAAAAGLAVTGIGDVIAGAGVTIAAEDGAVLQLTTRGYTHFD